MKTEILKTALLLAVLVVNIQASFAGESFTLISADANYSPYKAKLPRGASVLTFEASLGMPVSEDTVPAFYLHFPQGKTENLADITISDAMCTGEFNTQVTFLPTKSTIEMRTSISRN